MSCCSSPGATTSHRLGRKQRSNDNKAKVTSVREAIRPAKIIVADQQDEESGATRRTYSPEFKLLAIEAHGRWSAIGGFKAWCARAGVPHMTAVKWPVGTNILKLNKDINPSPESKATTPQQPASS